jgi:hypothetical protein
VPKSKHRRKPSEKAAAHPGQGKQGTLVELPADTEETARSEPKARREAPNTRGLPLFAPRVSRS